MSYSPCPVHVSQGLRVPDIYNIRNTRIYAYLLLECIYTLNDKCVYWKIKPKSSYNNDYLRIYKMTTYEESVQSALLVRKQDTVDDACEHLARSIWKMKQRYQQMQVKKNSRTMIVLNEVPTSVREQKHTDRTCQALTLKGKKCAFKSVNGCYCKKHGVSKNDSVLGVKPIRSM